MNAVGIFAGAGQARSVPQQLGAILYIPDLNTPVNGYWQDKSGKNKLAQAATTTIANDSLIMPANDADIIAALTLAGAYSKYYTNNSTPKKVLVSQIASIDSKYCVFFDAKTKTKFSLFKTQGDEARADKMYEFTFKAYTGGYFPITQTSDSVSFVIRGTGTHIFEWGDGTTTSYTLTTGADTTVSHTWSANLGGQKNISLVGNVKNWTRLSQASRSSDNNTIRITGMPLTLFQLISCPNINITGSITGMSLTNLSLFSCPNINITGSITGMSLTYLQLFSCPNINITGAITGMSLTNLQLFSCPNINITGSITGMPLTYLQLANCPNINIIGSIESCKVAATSIDVRQISVTYGGGATKAWNISQTIQAGWPSAMVDAWFNAYALTAPTVTAKTLNLAGINQAPTAASAAARTTITGKGFLIIIN